MKNKQEKKVEEIYFDLILILSTYTLLIELNKNNLAHEYKKYIKRQTDYNFLQMDENSQSILAALDDHSNQEVLLKINDYLKLKSFELGIDLSRIG